MLNENERHVKNNFFIILVVFLQSHVFVPKVKTMIKRKQLIAITFALHTRNIAYILYTKMFILLINCVLYSF